MTAAVFFAIRVRVRGYKKAHYWHFGRSVALSVPTVATSHVLTKEQPSAVSSKLLKTPENKSSILFRGGSSTNGEEPDGVDVRLEGLVEVSSPSKDEVRPLSGSSALAKGLAARHSPESMMPLHSIARPTAVNHVAKYRKRT